MHAHKSGACAYRQRRRVCTLRCRDRKKNHGGEGMHRDRVFRVQDTTSDQNHCITTTKRQRSTPLMRCDEKSKKIAQVTPTRKIRPQHHFLYPVGVKQQRLPPSSFWMDPVTELCCFRNYHSAEKCRGNMRVEISPFISLGTLVTAAKTNIHPYFIKA